MSNESMSSPEDGDVFLDYMLRSALTAPGASTSPTAGRILARLLVVIAIEGGSDLITPYLVPVPGQPATFEVRTYRPGDLTPTEVRSDLDSVAALRTAIRLAREGDAGIEVISQSQSGVERCVVVRDSTGEFEFRFAGGETLTGDPDDCLAARRAWAVTLSDWRSWVIGTSPVLEPTSGVRPVAAAEPQRALAAVEEADPEPARPPEPAAWQDLGADQAQADADQTAPEGVPVVTADAAGPAAVAVAPSAEGQAEGQVSERAAPPTRRPLFRSFGRPAHARRGRQATGAVPARPWGARPEPGPSPPPPLDPDPSDEWRDHSREGPAQAPESEFGREADAGPGADAGPDARPDEPSDAHPAPSEPANLEALLAAIREGFANLSLTAPPAPPPSPSPSPSLPPPPEPSDAALLAAIHDGFAGLSVEVDLGQVEAAIRRALDTDRRGLVEPLARRLAIVVRESLDIPSTREVVDSVVPLLPRPGDVADLVSSRIADLLSETVLRRGQSETAASPTVSGMMAAVDRFEVQIDGLHDQLRRATGVLETFGDRLHASDRRAALAERASASLEQEMRRLVQRVDEQVAALAASAIAGAGGGAGTSELSDGVSRLTRKLRQSVAQLDRALVRLDLVLDTEGAPSTPDGGLDELESFDPPDRGGYDVPR